jgi:hypothetical protein
MVPRRQVPSVWLEEPSATPVRAVGREPVQGGGGGSRVDHDGERYGEASSPASGRNGPEGGPIDGDEAPKIGGLGQRCHPGRKKAGFGSPGAMGAKEGAHQAQGHEVAQEGGKRGT